MRILLVNDANDASAQSEELLAAQGFIVLGVHDGRAALAALSEHRPDLVACDVRLRDDGGGSLAGRLRRESGGAFTVLALAEPEEEDDALRAGCFACLARPLDPDEMGEAARALRDGSAPTEALSRAVDALIAGRPEAAEDALSPLVELHAGTLPGRWALYLLARAHAEMGDRQSALEELSALVEDDPGAWRAHLQLAALFSWAGDAQTAARHAAFARATRREMPATPTTTSSREFPPAAAAPSPAAGPAPTAGSVVVADDSELALEMISEVLLRAGFTVRTAVDGTGALELARRERPDVMVLDGLMPGATGFDVCKTVKESLYPDNPPKVVILSAIYTKQRQRSEAFELYKVDEVLAKPFDDDHFIATVRRLAARPVRTP